MDHDIEIEADGPVWALDSAPLLAFDRSNRRIDVDGHMHVENCNISRANVCPYMGSEIPDADVLGLDSTKIYMLYRHAAELEAAAKSYENKPLMMEHIAVSADDPQKYYVVGTVSNVHWSPPYLKASLAVWDAEAIRKIDDMSQAQLSCGYRYTADMTPGTIDGEKYDGIMRNITANHVALVKVGRAGPDVMVADSLPQEIDAMKLSSVIAALKPFMATDAKVADIDAAVKTLLAVDKAKDEAEAKAAKDKAKDEADKDAKDCSAEDEDDKDAKDEDMEGEDAEMDMEGEDEFPKSPEGGAKRPGGKDKAKDSKAMDTAITAAVTAALARDRALHTAREEVKPILGVVQFDSAAQVYAEALKKIGIAVDGIHPSAYGALLRASIASKSASAVAGNDSAAGAGQLHEAFKGYNRLSR